jgi:hypothetical protein
MRKLKLFFLKWRLKMSYEKLLSMKDRYGCGETLGRYLYPVNIIDQQKKVESLYERCLALER